MKIPIDVHTHILPGMDDGSKSTEQSIEMLRREAEQGVPVVALTPHFYAFENSPDEFLNRRQASWERLQPHLNSEMPEIVLGAEVQYFEGISRVDTISKLCIGNTNYLLLEMPFCRWSERIIQEMFTLNRSGNIRIILAHIDRYFSMQEKSVWDRMYENRVLMQLNADAFLHFRTKYLAKHLLKKDRISFLGSDCHNLTNRSPNLFRVEEIADQYADSLISI